MGSRNFAVGVLMGRGEKGNLEDYGNVARLAMRVEYSRTPSVRPMWRMVPAEP